MSQEMDLTEAAQRPSLCGARRVASAKVAFHIMGVYQHYRWRKDLEDSRAQRQSPFDSLQPDPGWQSKLTDTRQRELSVWL